MPPQGQLLGGMPPSYGNLFGIDPAQKPQGPPLAKMDSKKAEQEESSKSVDAEAQARLAEEERAKAAAEAARVE